MSGRGDFPLTFRLQVQGDAEVANKFKNVATSMQQITPAAQKASQSTKQVDTSLKSTGTSATQASSSVKNYSGAMQGFSSTNTQARSSVEGFTGALNRFSTENTRAVGGLNQTNTVAKGLVPTMGNMGNQTTQTTSKMQKLTETFRGNRGLIFSVTMLSSGIFEAIGMFQGYQDAAEKLAAAQEKVNALEEQGAEHTKEYGDATRELADAQRGFNFVQRFTIQSFADLIPMSLMLTSSLLDMTSKMGGMATMKTKLAGATTKLTHAMKGLFAATMAFTLRHPLLLLLTALVGVALAVITNFMGVRDALNQFGVALGNAIGPLKGVLEWLGMIGNSAADTANSYLQFGTVAVEASTDVEKQVLKTGDATQLSYQQQIDIMNKFGEEAENLTFSVGAHLQKQQQDQKAHEEKYVQFVHAMESGNEDIMQSMALTADEYKEFYDQWQEELEAFDDRFSESVDSIIGNWERVSEGFEGSVDSTVGEIIKLEKKIEELTQESFELDDKKALKKNREEIAKNQKKIDELRGTIGSSMTESGAIFDIFGDVVVQNLGQKITPTMEQAGRDFITLGEQAKQGLDSIKLGILGQDFQGAIDGLATAIDGVPEKYRGNFSEIDSIIGNTALNNRQKVAQIISDYGSLENAFKPLISGAYELSRADAELASNFDELSVAARSNMTDMNQAEGAWNKFLSSLTPAQKELPMIQDLIARVNAGTITFGEALAEAEGHGRDFSRMLGKDIMTSIKNVEKSFIDLGDGTSAMVANVNGQMVNLGRVSNTELGNMSDDLDGVQTSMTDTSKTAKTELENEATASVGVLGKDGKMHFGTVVKGANDTIDVFKVVNSYADTYIAKGAGGKVAGFAETMKSTGKVNKTETDQWAKDFENFKTEAVKWLGQVQQKLDSLWQSAKERLSNTNFQNLLPNVQSVEGSGDGQQVSLDQAHNMMGTSKGGVAGGMTEQQLKALHQAWSSFSTSVATYTKSISTNVTNMVNTVKTQLTTLLNTGLKPLHTAFSSFSTSISTYMSSMTNAIGNGFIKPVTQMIAAFSPVITALQTQFSNFSTSISTYMGSMTVAVANFVSAGNQAFGALTNTVVQTQTAFSTFSTSVNTYMNSMTVAVSRFVSSSNQALGALQGTVKTTQQSFSTMSTSVATYMKSMTTNIQNFATSAVSNLKKVASAADAARSAFNRMASAAKAAERAARSALAAGAGSFQHGGSAILMGQRGFSGVINKPTTIGSGLSSVNVGEGFEPEFVSVTPLNKGTGNHTGNLKRASMGVGGGSPNSINAQFVIVLDGREMKRFIQKVSLENNSVQI